MSHLFYLSNNQLYHLNNNRSTALSCESITHYKRNLASIQRRSEWKTTGTGAQFMGYAQSYESDDGPIFPCGVTLMDEQNLIYAARLEEGVAIYTKSLNDLEGAEGLILRKPNFIVHDIDYDQQNKRLVMSANTSEYDFSSHLCLLPIEQTRIQYLTEGECMDANPIFDPQNAQRIIYDSCGLGYDAKGRELNSPKEICVLDLQTGDVDSLVKDDQYDFFKPQKDQQGNLYFIRRPYKTYQASLANDLKALVTAPFKIINAVTGWLDFFTQRYAGENLKTSSGINPAKAKQKSAEELFIEGNLIKTQETKKNNKAAGEKFPGIIPNSWELMKQTPDCELVCVKKGVLSYLLKNDLVIYSNGEQLIQLDKSGEESMLAEGKLIYKING